MALEFVKNSVPSDCLTKFGLEKLTHTKECVTQTCYLIYWILSLTLQRVPALRTFWDLKKPCYMLVGLY